MVLEKNLQVLVLFWSSYLIVTAYHPEQVQYSLYTGPHGQYNSVKPIAREKNHCAYVVEKTVSFTVQDGAAPFMKAMKCPWGQKCPKYRMYYKPMYKVAYKTLTEVEWKCCPGYTGDSCTEAYGMKARPQIKGPMPSQKGPVTNFKGPMQMQKGPIPPYQGHVPMQKGPMPPFKELSPMQKTPMHSFKGPMPIMKGPMPPFTGSMPSQKGPMPPFKGPMNGQKGPMSQFKGPMTPQKSPRPSSKGPMFMQKGQMHSFNSPMPAQKGPMLSFKGQNVKQKGSVPQAKGQYPRPNFNAYQRIQPSNGGFPGRNTPSSHDSSIETYPDQRETEVGYSEPMEEPQDLGHDFIPEDNEPITDYRDPQQISIPVNSETELAPAVNTKVPSGGSERIQDHEGNHLEVERLERIEEDVQRLSLGLETLRGTVTSLEDSLRASLREDANRMLTALISAAPSPIIAPNLSRDLTVGFGDLPGSAPDIEGSDVAGHFPNLLDLAEKITELQTEISAKASQLQELREAVIGHNNTLQSLMEGSVNVNENDFRNAMESLVESKMSEARVTILDGFEKRVESAEERCEHQMAEVRHECKKENLDGQEQIEQVLDIRAEGLRTELQKLQAHLQELEPEEGCCTAISGITERLILVEQSLGGLNESHNHLRADLGGHKDHIEGMLEGRLAYVESKMNVPFNEDEENISKKLPNNIEVELEGKLKTLEYRLLAAVEELGNVTTPTLLEGQVVPKLETEVDLLRRKVEDDLGHLQEQLKSMEGMCSSACVPQPVLTGYEAPLEIAENKCEDNLQDMKRKLDLQGEKLNNINITLNNLLIQLSERHEENIQGEVTLLKVSVTSVNKSICGLQESLGSVIKEVGHSNLTWQEREERLAQQVKGVVQLVGRQASMLGTGDRKLTRLKGELQDLRRRVTGELQGCRSTALGVQKEVTEVGGRVARVEGQCGGLAHLADDLERIRGDLERQTDGYLYQFNSTLLNHSQQLSELRDSIRNCTARTGSASKATDYLVTTQHMTEHTAEPVYPRGDQFAASTEENIR